MQAIEVVSTKIPIFDRCLQNVEGDDEECVGGGNRGLPHATAGGHSPELCGKIVILLDREASGEMIEVEGSQNVGLLHSEPVRQSALGLGTMQTRSRLWGTSKQF